jgi:hypothetical protein
MKPNGIFSSRCHDCHAQEDLMRLRSLFAILFGLVVTGSFAAGRSYGEVPPPESFCGDGGWTCEDQGEENGCMFCKGSSGGPKCGEAGNWDNPTSGYASCQERYYKLNGTFQSRSCWTWGDYRNCDDDGGSGGGGGDGDGGGSGPGNDPGGGGY